MIIIRFNSFTLYAFSFMPFFSKCTESTTAAINKQASLKNKPVFIG